MKWTPEKSTGIAYFIAVIAIGSIWYVLLFVGNVPNPNYGEMLHLWFVELPERKFFWWLTFLPSLCLALGVSYLTNIALTRIGALILCGLGIAAAIATWLTLESSVAIFVTLPLLFSIPRAKWHLTTRMTTDAR